MRSAEMFIQANQAFGGHVAAIDGAWDAPSPSTPGWTVRQLVDHVAGSNVELINYLKGSPPGLDAADDRSEMWVRSQERAGIAAGAETDPRRNVDGAFGMTSVDELLLMEATDRLIHAWDLARALGRDSVLEPGLVQAAYDFMVPNAEAARSAGMFGPEIPVPDSADVQDKLLALAGRDPSSHPLEPDGTGQGKADVIHRSS